MSISFANDLLRLMQQYNVGIGEVLSTLSFLDLKGYIEHGKVVQELSPLVPPSRSSTRESEEIG